MLVDQAYGWSCSTHSTVSDDRVRWIKPRGIDIPTCPWCYATLEQIEPDYLEDVGAMHEALVVMYNKQPSGWTADFERELDEILSQRDAPRRYQWCASAVDLATALVRSVR